MVSPSRPQSASHIDTAVVEQLVFECLTYPINKAYRNSFLASCGTIARAYLRSRWAAPAAPLPDAPVLCFGAFRNEMSAIGQALCENPDWHARTLDHRGLTSIDWRAALAPAMALVLPFIRAASAAGGALAVRNFAMPFIGYLVYQQLVREFMVLHSRPAVLTTNLVHPLSRAAHLAAKACGLRTLFWEHAMSPRIMIPTALGYDECHVNCEHTRQAFIEGGIPASNVMLIGDRTSPCAVPMTITPKRVAVCVNDLDSLLDTRTLVQKLVAARFEVVLRVHDSDIRFRQLRTMAVECRTSFSNAAESPIASFIADVDLVITGNSNVLLDCLRVDKPVVYLWPGDPKLFDYYGIVAASECLHFSRADNLVSHLSRLDERNEATI